MKIIEKFILEDTNASTTTKLTKTYYNNIILIEKLLIKLLKWIRQYEIIHI